MSDKLKANYDDFYDGQSEFRTLLASGTVNNIVALCNKHPHRTILEIGAGEGSLLKKLSDLQFGEALHAIEISKSAVETIRQRNIDALVECALFDGYNIPYDDNRFDLAILSHVVEHLEHPRKMLHEASRVAKYVFIEVPLEDTATMKRDFVFDKVGHINFYTPKTIRRLVQTCDLRVLIQIVTNSSYKIYRYWFGRKALLVYLPKELLLRISPGVATWLFSYHCALLCTRNTQAKIL